MKRTGTLRSIVAGLVVAGTVPLLASGAPAALSDFDPTFDSDGKVTTSFGTFDFAETVALQADGKIVVAGSADPGSAAPRDFGLARYLPTGALDASFGTSGKVLTNIQGSETVAGVAIQPDGRIVVAGNTAASIGSNENFAVVRYLPTGALDTSFGTGGKVVTDLSTQDTAAAMGLQTDGKILVAGATVVSGNLRSILVRYTSTGSLDPTFGSGGTVTTPIGMLSLATAVALQPDGKVVVGGGSSPDGVEIDTTLVRYSSAGVLDNTFDGDGIVTTSLSPDNENLTDLAIQPDGKIVAVGYDDVAPDAADLAVTRFTPEGTLDTTFSGDGRLTTSFTAGEDDRASAVEVQDDGKIVVAGSSTEPSSFEGDVVLARITSTGVLDSTFSGDGKVTFDIGTNTSSGAEDLVLQPDGKIVGVGGTQPSTFTSGDFGVFRLIGLPGISVSDVTVTEGDPEFEASAKFTISLSDTYDLPVTVDFFTRDGTATAAGDYEARSGTRTFLPGQKSMVVTIFLRGNTTQEATETFSLKLADPAQGYLVDDTGVATIIDNDVPFVTVNDVSAVELNGTNTKAYAFKVTLSKAGTNTITINYTTVDGTATAPADYVAKTGTLSIPAGTLTKTINVTVKGDNVVEPNETFILRLTSASFANIADADGLGTIVNND